MLRTLLQSGFAWLVLCLSVSLMALTLAVSARTAGPAAAPVTAPVATPVAGTIPVYDEYANASRDIAAAVVQATAANKRVLLVFGANWCADCRAFNSELDMPDLGSLVAERFVVVKIDVALFKKNTDVAAKYSVPIRRGIPAVGVMAPDGAIVAVADGRRMEELRSQGRSAVVKFLEASLRAATTSENRP